MRLDRSRRGPLESAVAAQVCVARAQDEHLADGDGVWLFGPLLRGLFLRLFHGLFRRLFHGLSSYSVNAISSGGISISLVSVIDAGRTGTAWSWRQTARAIRSAARSCGIATVGSCPKSSSNISNPPPPRSAPA